MENKPDVEWRLDIEEFSFAGCMHNCSGKMVIASEDQAWT